jgi:protein-S-isoprenylcysteine O-methyltransferase Ste14
MLKLIPPIWGAIYFAIAGAMSVAFPWRTWLDLQIVWLGALLIVAGLTLSFSCMLLFRHENTEILPTSKANRTLVVRGPYLFTRNPMYLGFVFVSLGIAFCFGSLPLFVVPILVFATTNWVHIPFEEAKMRRQFGDAFHHYTNRTRRWI